VPRSRAKPSRTRGGGRFYEAAIDSAQDHLWPEERVEGEEAVAGLADTQRRHLEISGKGWYHRVLVGPYATRDEARRTGARIRAEGWAGYTAVREHSPDR